MKKTFTAAAALVFLLSACGNGAGATDESDNSFEDYLEEHDPDSYDTYQTLESNWNEGNWNSEDGFLGDSSDYDSTKSGASYDSNSFEEYLKEHDPDSYDTYQTMESNWNEGNWNPENGFLGDSSDYDSTKSGASYDSNSFEEYLKEHDPASYDTYQKLESNWAEGDWDPENGFLGD